MRSLKNCLQQVTQAVGHTSTRYPQKKITVLQLINQKNLQWGLLPISPWQENEEHFPFEGEMSAVLVARYRDVSRAINCFCPTNKHFCGILWGIPLGHTPPNGKETHSGCLMLRLKRKINWFDLVMHDSPRMAIWRRGDSRFDYGLLSRSCSFQKAKAWCFRTYKQRIAKRYMWHHVPRCPHAFSTCHFIEWKLVLCNILHHL